MLAQNIVSSVKETGELLCVQLAACQRGRMLEIVRSLRGGKWLSSTCYAPRNNALILAHVLLSRMSKYGLE